MINVNATLVKDTGSQCPGCPAPPLTILTPPIKHYYQMSNGLPVTSDDIMTYQLEIITKLSRVISSHILHGLNDAYAIDEVSLKLAPSNSFPTLEFTLERLEDAEQIIIPEEPDEEGSPSDDQANTQSDGETPPDDGGETSPEQPSEGSDGEQTEPTTPDSPEEPTLPGDEPTEDETVEKPSLYPAVFQWTAHWIWQNGSVYYAEVRHEDVFDQYYGLEPTAERVSAWLVPQLAKIVRDMIWSELEEITKERYDAITKSSNNKAFSCSCINASSHNCDCAAIVDNDTGLTWLCNSCGQRFTGNTQLFYDVRSGESRALCLRCTYMAIRELLTTLQVDQDEMPDPFAVCICSTDEQILEAVLEYIANPIVGMYFKRGAAAKATCCCTSGS